MNTFELQAKIVAAENAGNKELARKLRQKREEETHKIEMAIINNICQSFGIR